MTLEHRNAALLIRSCIRLLLVLLALVHAGSAYAQSAALPPRPAQPLLDQADMLTPTQEQALAQKLVGYEDSTSNQIAVVTLPTLEDNDPIEYAVRLGRSWGVGQAERNNGVVLLVSREDRTITIAVGQGLQGVIPDVIADRIRRQVIVPLFRQERYYEGLTSGVDALMMAAAGEFKAEPRSVPGRQPRGVDFSTLIVLGIIAFFIFSNFGGRGGGRGRGRRYHRRGWGGPPVIIWGGGGFGGLGGGGGGFGGGGGGGWGGFGGGGFDGGGASGEW